MKDYLELIQLIVATLGMLAAAFGNLIQRLFPSAEKGEDASTQGKPPTVLRDYEDLAIGLASCAIFTLTAGHSIAIAGENPTTSFMPVFSMSVGALFMGAITFSAWKAGRLGRALWLLALAAIVVMILGPGGPLSPIDHDRGRVTLYGVSPSAPYEPPLPYWAALSLLVAIFIVGVIVEFPQALDIHRGVSRLLVVVFAIGLVVVSLSSGAAFVQQVLNAPTTPPQLEAATNQWLRKAAQSLSPSALHQLYRQASEAELLRSYRSRFVATLRELQSTQEQDFGLANKKSDDSDDSDDSLDSSGQPRRGAASQQQARNETRDLLSSSFLLSDADRRSFLETRLLWRHPISADGAKSGLIVPGIEPEDRQLTLSRFVQPYAIAELARTYGMNPPDQPPAGRGEEEPGQLSNNEALYHAMRNIFPSLGAYGGRTRLVQQLSLPLNYESFLAYLMYQHVAVARVGNAEVVYRQFFVGADALQTLFEAVQMAGDDKEPISVLFKVRQCAGYSSLQPDLVLLAQSRPALVAEGMREVFHDKMDKENSRLVELFLDRESEALVDGDTNKPNSASESRDAGSPSRAKEESSANIARRNNAVQRAEKFAAALKGCANSERDVRALFAQGGQAGPASLLLHPQVLDFLYALGSDGRSPEEREQLALKYLHALVFPIEPALLAEVPEERGVIVAGGVPPLLTEFVLLPEQERRGALHHMAVRLYAAGGPFSPSAIGSVISQTQNASDWGGALSVIIATVVVFPIFVIALLVGLVGGRLLLDRSALLLQADQEWRSPRQGTASPPDSPTDFLGREDLLAKLAAFARRGWNTVALVGPRGVGKSELLKRLIRAGSDETSIGIWMQAPTDFDQGALVMGVKRRLAEALERRISEYVGAAHWSERRLREEAHTIAARVFLVLMGMSTVLSYAAFSNAARLDLSAIWAPIGALGILATSSWFVSAFVVQRQDLGLWLRRSSRANPHLELLYDRCMLELLGLSPATSRKIRWLRLLQNFALISIPIVLLVISGPLWDPELLIEGLIGGEFGAPTFHFAALLISGSAAIFFGLHLYRRELMQRAYEEAARANTVESYRDFVRFCIDRLGEGALGEVGQRWRFLVAIDELDRLTEIDDLRRAIIRMRGLFEIRGAFYYLSMASDSLKSFLKGDWRSKTELDSVFDHIERVEPLGFTESRMLVEQYLHSRGVRVTDALQTAVALVAFGIPRDAIRNCDRVIAFSSERGIQEPGLAELKLALGIPSKIDSSPEPMQVSDNSRVTQPESYLAVLRILAVQLSEKGSQVSIAFHEQLIALGFSLWEGTCTEREFRDKVESIENRFVDI